MNTKHTPTPYSISGITGDNCVMAYHPGKSGKLIVATVYALGKDDDEVEATKAFIVQACNAHDELVGALQQCELAMMRARIDAVKIDEANGDRLNHKHHKVFPCNQTVVHATQGALDMARSILAKVKV